MLQVFLVFFHQSTLYIILEDEWIYTVDVSYIAPP